MKVALLSFAHRRAEAYARVLRDRSDVRLLAADDDPVRAKDVAARLDIPVASAWDAVFAERPDAVVVTSPPAGHRALVARAAESGAHVLCAQPVATTETEALAMVAACERAEVGLTMVGTARVSPAFAALRRAVAENELGPLLAVHAVRTEAPPAAWDPAAHGGGALADCAPDLLDLVDGLLDGERPAQVYAQANRLLDPSAGVESAALLTVRYPSGPIIALDCRWSSSSGGHGPVATVVGERASVEFEPAPRLLDRFDAATGHDRWEPGGADLDAGVLNRFVTGVRDGVFAGPDAEAGLRVLRVVLAAYRSIETGQPVDLP